MAQDRDSKDLYGVLGVPRDADKKQIRKAFYERWRSLSPRLSTDPDAQAEFGEVTHAYEVLSEESSRTLYDEQTSRVLTVPAAPVRPPVDRPSKKERRIKKQRAPRIVGRPRPRSRARHLRPQRVRASDLSVQDDPIVLAVALSAFAASIVVLVALLVLI